ncbi:MAG: GumC family protein [Acidobacteriota bacterium]
MMQTQDLYSVGRRSMDTEDYVDVLRRHKSWILGPFFAGLVIATVVACLWPDTYVSSAVIRVTPPQVPERFVQSALNQMLNERITGISQQVLSRSALVNIIQTFDLYERDRRRLPMEDIVDRMRTKDISIGTVSLSAQSARGGAFPVSFKYEDRYKAQKVTQEVVSRLINENTRVQLGVTQNTTDFLTEELQKAKLKLDQIEQSLASFRMKNAGRLPDERSMNFTALQATETRIATINAALQRINQERLMTEAQLRLQREQMNLAMAAAAASASGSREVGKTRAANERLIVAERDILSAEQSLARLREQYKETYPDVQRAKTNLQTLQRERDRLLKQEEEAKAAEAAEAAKRGAAKTPPVSVPVTKDIQAMQLSLKQMETLVQAKTVEEQDYKAELVRLNGQVREFQGRIGSTPIADQEFSALTRDYDSAKMEYQQLLAKQSDARRGQEVEKRNQGETLELLDAASLPVEPTEPKRPLIILGGALMGLVLGLVLTGGREMKDTTLKNLKDVRAYTNLTVLGSIPLLEDDVVVMRRKRLTLLAWSTSILVGILVMAGSYYYYIATKP